MWSPSQPHSNHFWTLTTLPFSSGLRRALSLRLQLTPPKHPEIEVGGMNPLAVYEVHFAGAAVWARAVGTARRLRKSRFRSDPSPKPPCASGSSPALQSILSSSVKWVGAGPRAALSHLSHPKLSPKAPPSPPAINRQQSSSPKAESH